MKQIEYIWYDYSKVYHVRWKHERAYLDYNSECGMLGSMRGTCIETSTVPPRDKRICKHCAKHKERLLCQSNKTPRIAEEALL